MLLITYTSYMNALGRTISLMMGVAIAYFLTGWGALYLSIPPGYAAPLWPPAGIALAATLLWGYRMGPAIWLGSVATGILLSAEGANMPFAIVASTSVGAVLEAYFARWFIERQIGINNPLHDQRSIILFALIIGPISCVINALWSNALLLGAGIIGAQNLLTNGLTWWVGDVIGCLIFTPLLLIVLGEPRDIWRKRFVPVALPLLLLFSMMVIIFLFVRSLEIQVSIDRPWIAWGVLAGGLFVTSLLTLFLFGLTNRSINIENKIKNRLKYYIQHDILTGLPNRATFQQYLKRTLATAYQKKSHFSLLYIDLHGFTHINESLGNSVGDQVLQFYANRIQYFIQEKHFLARLGSDEFVIIMESLTDVSEAGSLAQEIIHQNNEPFEIGPHTLIIEANIGIAVYPMAGEDIQTLMHNTDFALKKSKEKGKNSFQYFTARLNEENEQHLKIESLLREALEKNELELHYQPEYALKTKKIIGVEALLRWNHPEVNISVQDIILIAEETGLSAILDSWVLNEACRQYAEWRNQFGSRLENIRLSVNISAKQTSEWTLVDNVRNSLIEYNIPAEKLILEITESAMIKNIQSGKEILFHLTQMGVNIAIDDFGSGYASLGYIRKLPIQYLKIDKSLIDTIENKRDTKIVQAIIELGRVLNLNVIAEGVETVEQEKILLRLECPYAQGYLYNRPLNVNVITDYFARNL